MTAYDVAINYDTTYTWSDVIEADDIEDAEYKAMELFKEDMEGDTIHNVVVEEIKEVRKET